jgi:hypothetical protein
MPNPQTPFLAFHPHITTGSPVSHIAAATTNNELWNRISNYLSYTQQTRIPLCATFIRFDLFKCLAKYKPRSLIG